MKRKRKDIIDVIFKLQANQESINDRWCLVVCWEYSNIYL
jgi:hypothetical protein